MKKAVVLLSGGMDSATVLYMAKAEGYEVYAISFNYGQRHAKELQCARQIAAAAGVRDHVVVETNLNAWGGSALTDPSIAVPDSQGDVGGRGDADSQGDVDSRSDAGSQGDAGGRGQSHHIPVTYVPARNMIFLAFAASYAEVIGAQDIFIGVSEVDYSGYVDCRQEFLDAMEKAINKGTVCAVEEGRPLKIHAPLVQIKKSEEIEIGLSLGVDYGLTWTCYRGEELACGTCDSCKLRLEAFRELRMVDPLPYQNALQV